LNRVLVVEAAGNLWGSERSLLDLLGTLPSSRVAVCCPPDTPLVAELTKRQVRTLPYYVDRLHQKSRGRRLQAALGVLRACLEFRPDVIHLNQSGSYRVVLPAAAMLRVPLVAHVRIFEDIAYLAQQEPNVRRLAALIAISKAVESEIRQQPNLAAIPVHRLYDSYVAHPEDGLLQPVQRASNRVACVGRLVPVKGQDVLIKALGRLQLEGDPRTSVECLIVGGGDQGFVDDLRAMAAAEHVTDTIRWQGFVHDVVPVLRGCAALVCPSHREPLGRVIFEAWNAGAVPVVYGESGGAAEVVRAANGGVVYAEQTPKALAQAIRATLDLRPDERSRLIAQGREWMSENCDPARYGARVSTIFRDASAQPPVSIL
jgi:glycosyltransferase involved in cell wall biosynthesis